jgi:hypothetical protein
MPQEKHQLIGYKMVKKEGPWPFITRIHYHHPQLEPLIWKSRDHRKGFHVDSCPTFRYLKVLWKPQDLNWWIGLIFAIGASFFILGCLLCLSPTLAEYSSLDSSEINSIFFMGSIPFTTAAYLQLFQAANTHHFGATNHKTSKFKILGWKPKDIGWLSSAFQFCGTLLFNLNTFKAISPPENWLQEDLWIWIPDVFGSIFFLISGYLAFIEVGHKHGVFHLKNMSWWITFINLLGCIAFMVSAIYAFIPHENLKESHIVLSLLFTLIGAFCFCLGAILMIPENAKKYEVKSSRQR